MTEASELVALAKAMRGLAAHIREPLARPDLTDACMCDKAAGFIERHIAHPASELDVAHLTPDQLADVQAHLDGLREPPIDSTYDFPTKGRGWVCFHCGKRFVSVEGAQLHFGATPDQPPSCFRHAEPAIDRERLVEIIAKNYNIPTENAGRSIHKLADAILAEIGKSDSREHIVGKSVGNCITDLGKDGVSGEPVL